MLSDQIDRLSRNTRAIRGIAAQTASSHLTLFTNAVLSVPLGDLIRDIDPAELGLFSLQSSQPTRAEFTGATPLRKQRDDVHKTNEIEPETYAEAALKCIDRYHTIRPMPRGQSQINTILERLALVRDNIQNLSDTLRQAQSTQERSLKSLIDEEEERIRNLQVRLKQLNERVRHLIIFRPPFYLRLSRKNNAQKPLADRRLAGVRPTPKTKPPPPPLSPQEDDFWNTPAVGARTLRFTDNLMDEQVDLGDITTSFISPIHYSKPGALSPPVRDDSFVQDPLVPLSFERNDDDDEKGHLEEEKDISELDGEKKIVLQNHFPEPDITEPGCSPAPKPQEVAHETNMPAVLNTPDASTVKVKVNSEVERITARIWTTIGDLIMPGHPFDTSSHGLGAKPPRAKETL
ncbi:hypothetical protein H0H81_011844 [Sphagnurus paluster]|uniref:Uncharacterized protein n=1 Tax=Sphagnurus paluster TaxID=117069 RepID=A0A9P7GP10_9AGAR|nr:hypothetical protein H0H81_011844 [Sphagnurus paluster]